MKNVNRRHFIQASAGMVAATAAGSAMGEQATNFPKAQDIRTLGSTGLKCSYLGMGTGVGGSALNITRLVMKLTGEEYVDLIEHAYRQGLTFFDMADRYGSHRYMAEAMRRSVPREKVMLLSKIWSRDAKQVQLDLDRMRYELNTDCIDVVLMHCLRGGEDNWPEKLKPAMDVLSEAKAKGHIKAHGVSCHTFASLEKVADTEWADVVMARINPAGKKMDGPVREVVPVLQKIHESGKGVIAMKVFGEGDPGLLAKMDEALNYVSSLGCIDIMTIGYMNKNEMEDTIGRVNRMA